MYSERWKTLSAGVIRCIAGTRAHTTSRAAKNALQPGVDSNGARCGRMEWFMEVMLLRSGPSSQKSPAAVSG